MMTTTREYLRTELPKEWKSCQVSEFLLSTIDDDVNHMVRVAFAHVYNFNRVEAASWFLRAKMKGCDPVLCDFGIAYANGVDYNKTIFVDDREAKEAYDHVRSARERIDPKKHTPVLIALIKALSERYEAPRCPATDHDYKRLNRDYANAMRQVYKKYHATSADVCALYAESLMQMRPWKLWSTSRDPETLEIKSVLELGLKSWSDHPGLCHLYVHLMEMSSEPETALKACETLRRIFSRNFGHLAHMPSHIDMQIGAYDKAIISNELGIRADLELLKIRKIDEFYFGYLAHNFHMCAWAAMFDGQYARAIKAATDIVEITPISLIRAWSPDLESYVGVKWHVWIRFGRWKEILDEPLRKDEKYFSVCICLGLYAKGIACAAMGHVREAKTYQEKFRDVLKKVPELARMHNVRAHQFLAVADKMLDGELMYRCGELERAFELLRTAVRLEDELPYDEPWGWMSPTRHALGALLLESGRVLEAEKVFRKDLKRYPMNLWALTGLLKCIQEDENEKRNIRRMLAIASARADIPVGVACFCARGNKMCCTNTRSKEMTKRRKLNNDDEA
ncbi:hypothetical protein OAV88_01400 [bacterium]|nr:hypothetical protein [bacterium]